VKSCDECCGTAVERVYRALKLKRKRTGSAWIITSKIDETTGKVLSPSKLILKKTDASFDTL